jgi:hypothetical protein
MKNFLGRGRVSVIKDRRAASRRGYNEDAWFRAEQSLLRECRVLDLSRTGVRLTITNPQTMPDKRRHNQIGAEYSSGAERSLSK